MPGMSSELYFIHNNINIRTGNEGDKKKIHYTTTDSSIYVLGQAQTTQLYFWVFLPNACGACMSLFSQDIASGCISAATAGGVM